VECVGSRQRTFAGVGGSFVLCVFGSRDLTEPGFCLGIGSQIRPR
jgi:hypothetical protein